MSADGNAAAQTPHDAAAPFPAPRFLDRATPPNIVTLVALSGLSALSISVFLPALVEMTAHFRTDYALMQLSVGVYLGANAIFQVFIGTISDRYGRRPVVLAALALFMIATLGCVYAGNVWVFLAFRMMQAFVVTGLVLSRAVIRDMFPSSEAASRIGYVTMGMAVVPMIGPAIGGGLNDLFGWETIFWLLLISGLACFALTWADMGETAPRKSANFADQFAQYPELFASPRFWAYCLASAFSAGAFFAYLGGAPYISEVMFGLSSSTMGMFFGAPAIGYFVGNFLSGRYSTLVGLNRMLLIGSIIVPVGLTISVVLFYGGIGGPWVFFGFMTFVGLGNGMVIPNATAAMLSVRPELAGTASGIGGAIMIGGGAALSALAGWLLTPESGPYPLIWLMIATGAAGTGCSIYAWVRSRRLGFEF